MKRSHRKRPALLAWLGHCRPALAMLATTSLLVGNALGEELLSETGTLTESDEEHETRSYQDTYEVEVNEGDLVEFDMRSNLFDTYLTVLGPEGSDAEWSNDDFRGAYDRSHLSFFAPTSGTYQVIAHSYNGEGRGEYEVAVTSLSGTFSEVLEESGDLSRSDEQLPNGEYYDTYTLQVEAGTILRGKMNSVGFFPYVVIQRDGVTEVWEARTAAGARDLEFAIPLTDSGEIEILATSRSAHRSGDYDLTLSIGQFADANAEIAINARTTTFAETTNDGLFADPVVLESEGGFVDVTREAEGERGFGYAAARMADIDNDGQVDLVLGEVGGRLFWYRNTSSDPTAPALAEPALLRLGDGSSAELTNW